MYGSKGRSGIGDTNIQGTWEDFDGLSPNGRQYRNALTQEVRNLSGADYWHARKANYPKEEPEVWVNGKANVRAFCDNEPVKPAKKRKSVADSIDLANRHLECMEKLSAELEAEYAEGLLTTERYSVLRHKMDARLEKAWKRVEKENGYTWNTDLDDNYGLDDEYEECKKYSVIHPELNYSKAIMELKNDNVFKVIYLKYKDIEHSIKNFKFKLKGE